MFRNNLVLLLRFGFLGFLLTSLGTIRQTTSVKFSVSLPNVSPRILQLTGHFLPSFMEFGYMQVQISYSNKLKGTTMQIPKALFFFFNFFLISSFAFQVLVTLHSLKYFFLHSMKSPCLACDCPHSAVVLIVPPEEPWCSSGSLLFISLFFRDRKFTLYIFQYLKTGI